MSEGETFVFGPFSVSVARRELHRGEELVPLGSRAFDVLLALLRRHGHLAAKDELLAEAWPDTSLRRTTSRSRFPCCAKRSVESMY
jgi:DNA-binding winged helix-turn-helix (wHTH) protein